MRVICYVKTSKTTFTTTSHAITSKNGNDHKFLLHHIEQQDDGRRDVHRQRHKQLLCVVGGVNLLSPNTPQTASSRKSHVTWSTHTHTHTGSECASRCLQICSAWRGGRFFCTAGLGRVYFRSSLIHWSARESTSIKRIWAFCWGIRTHHIYPISFFTVCGFGSGSFSSTKCVLSSSSSSSS